MIDGIRELWNFLTGSQVSSNQDYIEYFFGVIDVNKEGKVS
jgi:hypothetical protein